MQLKYIIEAVEVIEDKIDLKPKELTQLKNDIQIKLTEALNKAGIKLATDINLSFDLIGDDDIETW